MYFIHSLMEWLHSLMEWQRLVAVPERSTDFGLQHSLRYSERLLLRRLPNPCLVQSDHLCLLDYFDSLLLAQKPSNKYLADRLKCTKLIHMHNGGLGMSIPTLVSSMVSPANARKNSDGRGSPHRICLLRPCASK